jgi:hypothetical protein
MEQIIITISPEGDTKVKVQGVAGPGCQELSREIERALGSVAKDTPTREMYEVKQHASIKNRS